MPLSDIAIRSAKPSAKPQKLSDEKGLFLLLTPSGGKLWRLKYRYDGKEKKLSFGSYPEVSLREARRRRDDARTQIACGIDPSQAKKALIAAFAEEKRNSFGAVAEDYFQHIALAGREAVTVKKSRWLFSLMQSDLAERPIAHIKPADLLASFRKIEAKGHYETARRMRSLASRIFRYAVATSRAETDPTSLLRGALIPPKVTHHAAVLEPKKVGALLRAIDGYDGQPLTGIALKLTPHLFVRPGELRRAEWPEFDFDKKVWVIPAEKMKMRHPHVVPLSRQSLALLQAAFALSSNQKFVFSSLYPGDRPMSENTVNAALRRLGFSGNEMTAHGFRALASTLLNESGRWSTDAIERALAHKDSNGVRAAYNRGLYWEERVAMAQWWSDFLAELFAEE
jgi:integrase